MVDGPDYIAFRVPDGDGLLTRALALPTKCRAITDLLGS